MWTEISFEKQCVNLGAFLQRNGLWRPEKTDAWAEDLVKRFWEKVEKTETCWNWKASCHEKGYGQFNLTHSKNILVHRLTWEITMGEIPKGLFVCHTCDVRFCVNPNHLFVGTAKQNTQDAVKKSRLTWGIKHWCSKLTEQDVREIRSLVAKGKSGAEISRVYSVTKELIYMIRDKKIWKHLPA